MRSATRQLHRDAVIRALRLQGAASRRDLQEATGLSRSTISSIVNELMAEGEVERCSAARTGRGRPVELIRVVEDAQRTWLGIEFSHGSVHVVLVQGDNQVRAQACRSYTGETTWSDRFAIASEVLARETPSEVAVSGVGIGFPSSAVMRGEDLITRGQEGALELIREVAAQVGQRYRAAVSVDNNVRLAGLAEMLWQTEAQPENQIYARVSDGIGGALVCNGQLVTGQSGFGGEIGHLTVEADGVRCRCGKRGCLETVASASAIIRRCRQGGAQVAGIEDVAQAYHQGRRVAVEAVTEAGQALGKVLGRVCVLIDPARIVLAGTVVSALPHLVDVVRDQVGLELLPVNQVLPRTVHARLGEDAGALGAALMAMSATRLRYPILIPDRSVN
ncbi:ROK family transcriptional regulator [Actinomyces sp. ZJ751]|uniref:ROK family transcriptional regulator n=1 Tax=Actinomyces sp. ZJ751 TaxID=2708341 RepID=UPI001423C559|nr:ROK family transcriptional regulator [Actinomyces sp. ZJ751]